MKKPKDMKKCPMTENCWEQIPVHKAFCAACTSWWHRIQMKDTNELSRYMQRMGRFSGRFHVLSNKGKSWRSPNGVLHFRKRA